MVLRHLRGEVFLTLKQSRDVALEFDQFARDSLRRTRTDEAPAQGSRKDGGGENYNITQTHGNSS
jgi:hypothetical protein